MSSFNEQTQLKSATLTDYPDYLFFEDGSVWSHELTRFLKQEVNATREYRKVKIKNYMGERKVIRTHVLVALAFLGERPNGYVIDHANQDKLDNRVCNLRYVTLSVNYRNSAYAQNCSCKYAGVTVEKKSGKYVAQLFVDGKTLRLGRYTNELEAAQAYDREARKHGRHLNFPAAIATELLQIQN